ncbi:MAG: ADOP family duplicated permease [Candidatus Acidiferrales bacterium]
MKLWNRMLAILRVWRAATDRDLDDELRDHIERRVHELRREGLSAAEARRRALVELGGVQQIKEEVHAMRSGIWLEALAQDVRFAARQLRAHPGFTLVAVLTLALGIGASTAIFSVVNSVVLRSLPYPDAERLVVVHQTAIAQGGESLPFSPPNYIDFRDQARSFAHFGGGWASSAILTGDEPERLEAAYVRASLLDALGVQAQIGRLLNESDEAAGAPRPVLLSHGLWERRFGRDRDVLGRMLVLNDKAHTVVGVLPPRVDNPFSAEVWMPLKFAPSEMQERFSFYVRVVARLAPGITPEQAQAELDTIAQRLAQQRPDTNKDFGARLVTLHEHTVGDVRATLLWLLGAVGCVWLIACANVANLMLTRAASREREMAVRRALGAGHARLAAQLLTESILLALAGGAAGLLLGRWCVTVLIALRPQHLPRFDEVRLDPHVFAFAVAISLAAGILFGLFPALRAARPEWAASLKSGAQTTAPPHTRTRGALVVAQLSLSLVLLAGAGLMLRTLWTLLSTPPGFDPRNVLVADLLLPVKYNDLNRRLIFTEAVLGRLAALPGVESAGAANLLPLSGGQSTQGFRIEGKPQAASRGDALAANYRVVSPGYLRLLRIPLRQGRGIEAHGHAAAPPVVLINEAMAQRYWPGENPLGRRISILRRGEPAFREIVGIVGDIRHEGLHLEAQPEMYVAIGQPLLAYVSLAVRTAGDPASLASALREAVWAVDPDQPVSRVRTMDDVVATSIGETRFYSLLLGVFAALALGLAAVGIYGVMSYAVAARTREIGIRLALGAQRRSIFRLVLARGARLTALGIVLGLAGALAATRGIEKLLYGVQPTDAVTFASVAAVLALVALIACWLPARRAMRVDAAITLRYE